MRRLTSDTVEYQFGEIGAKHFLVYALLGEVVAYIGHIQAVYGICEYHGGMSSVVDTEIARSHTLIQYLAHHYDFALGYDLASTVYLTHVAKESRLQTAVARYYLAHHLKPATYKLYELLLCRNRLGEYPAQTVSNLVGFALNNSIKDIALTLEIGVHSATPLLRSGCYVIHRSILDPLAGK